MEALQRQNVELQGQLGVMEQELQRHQEQIRQLHQGGAVEALHQHLAEDRRQKVVEFEEGQVDREVRRLEKCDGSEPAQVKSWLKELDLVPAARRTEVAGRTATQQLRRELERFLEGHAQRRNAPWLEVSSHLLHAFVSTDNKEATRKELDKIRQEIHESLISYNRRFRELAEESYPLAARNEDQERTLVKAYGKGLAHDSTARKLVSNGWPENLEAAIRRTAQLETSQEVYDHLGRQVSAMEVGSAAATPKLAPQQPKPQPSLEVQQLRSHIAKLEAQINRLKPAYTDNRNARKCYSCGAADHLARDCPRPQQGHRPAPRGRFAHAANPHPQTKN